MIDPALARRFCETLARGLAYQDIRPALDTPYLRRYFVAGWQPRATKGPAVFLHHFVSSDPDDAVHSHPWEFGLSLILVGGYVEHRATANGGPSSTRTYGPGDTNILEPGDRHRIDLLGRDCWSLFLAGEYAQPWGFYELT